MIDVGALGSGLILLAIGGVTVLAYREPEIYADIRLFLMLLIAGLVIIIVFYGLGSSNTYILLIPYIEQSKIDQANLAYESKTIPWWIAVCLIALAFYFWLLSDIFSGRKNKNDQKDE